MEIKTKISRLFICNKNQLWYQNDNLHRMDGPAYIEPDGYEQ